MSTFEGPFRRWLRGYEPLLKRRLGDPQVTVYPPVDKELEAMREAKKREWKALGYPDALIEKALLLADGWVGSMAETWAPPGRSDIREAIVRNAYPKALMVGEAWIKAMMK